MAKKKWNLIVERTTEDGSLRHWFFSFDLSRMLLYPSGYRLYEKGADGRYTITERAYTSAHGLPDVRGIDTIDLPDDVKAEALEEFTMSITVDNLRK